MGGSVERRSGNKALTGLSLKALDCDVDMIQLLIQLLFLFSIGMNEFFFNFML